MSHASDRAKERYGIDLTNEDLQNISKLCQSKTCDREYIKNLGYGKHHLHIKYKGIWFNLVWSSTTNIVVSILHPKSDPQPKQ